MDTYGDAGGYGDTGEFYGGGGGNGGSAGIPSGDEEKRMGGEGAIRKPPHAAR